MSNAASFIPKIFLAGAFFGAIGCLSRADYNLPIFLFAYIAWNYLRVTIHPFILKSEFPQTPS